MVAHQLHGDVYRADELEKWRDVLRLSAVPTGKF